MDIVIKIKKKKIEAFEKGTKNLVGTMTLSKKGSGVAIDYIDVPEPYQKKGIATKLYKALIINSYNKDIPIYKQGSSANGVVNTLWGKFCQVMGISVIKHAGAIQSEFLDSVVDTIGAAHYIENSERCRLCDKTILKQRKSCGMCYICVPKK